MPYTSITPIAAFPEGYIGSGTQKPERHDKAVEERV